MVDAEVELCAGPQQCLCMDHAEVSACASFKSHAVNSQRLLLHVMKVRFAESSLR